MTDGETWSCWLRARTFSECGRCRQDLRGASLGPGGGRLLDLTSAGQSQANFPCWPKNPPSYSSRTFKSATFFFFFKHPPSVACGHAWKKKKGIPFYPQLSSCGCRQHLSTGGMRASHCGWGAEGSTRRSGGHIHVTKQTPPVEGNSYCHAIRHFGATKQLLSRAPELCSPGSIGGGQARAGCFCSITDALNLLSSMMGSPGCDFFQVSLHKPLCKLLMESTSFVVYRKESWESGKWKLSVSQVIRDRTGPGIQNC